MRPHITRVIGFTTEFKIGGAAVRAIGGNRHGRQIIVAIRQGKTVTEGAIRAQFDFMAAQGHLGPRLRGAVDNQLGIHAEPEAFFRRRSNAKGNRRTGDRFIRRRTGAATHQPAGTGAPNARMGELAS